MNRRELLKLGSLSILGILPLGNAKIKKSDPVCVVRDNNEVATPLITNHYVFGPTGPTGNQGHSGHEGTQGHMTTGQLKLMEDAAVIYRLTRESDDRNYVSDVKYFKKKMKKYFKGKPA
jgi:hypothetical protein